jgi:hypothetical protein
VDGGSRVVGLLRVSKACAMIVRLQHGVSYSTNCLRAGVSGALHMRPMVDAVEQCGQVARAYVLTCGCVHALPAYSLVQQLTVAA